MADPKALATFRWKHAIRLAILGDPGALSGILRSRRRLEPDMREDIALLVEGRLFVPDNPKGRPAIPVAVLLGRMVNRSTPIKRAADRYLALSDWVAARRKRGQRGISLAGRSQKLKEKFAREEGVNLAALINLLRRGDREVTKELELAAARETAEITYFEKK
jgi:hypothetical protein